MEITEGEFGGKKMAVYLYRDVKDKAYVRDLITKYPNNLAICNAELVFLHFQC